MVANAVAMAGATMRARAENMPTQIAPQLTAAAGDEDRCAAILADWVESYLVECSASFAGIAATIRKRINK